MGGAGGRKPETLTLTWKNPIRVRVRLAALLRLGLLGGLGFKQSGDPFHYFPSFRAIKSRIRGVILVSHEVSRE